MRELETAEVESIGGGFNPWVILVTTVFIHDALQDFAEGVQSGYDQATAEQ